MISVCFCSLEHSADYGCLDDAVFGVTETQKRSSQRVARILYMEIQSGAVGSTPDLVNPGDGQKF